MPPVPSYPPSSSSYQPLSHTADENDWETRRDSASNRWDLEASVHANSGIRQRSFLVSPYQSQANDPTGILKSFLSETRSRSGDGSDSTPKRLALRITMQSAGSSSRSKSVKLPLPELSDTDSIPFALPDDVPCLRGLPSDEFSEWRQIPKSFLRALQSPSRRVDVQDQLQLRHYSNPVSILESQSTQVWNAVQKKPLYASSEEVERYRARLAKGTAPPWAPLTEVDIGTQQEAPRAVPSQSKASAKTKASKKKQRHAADQDSEEDDEAEDEEEEYDPYDINPLGQGGDFDLSSVFKKSRKRTASRLVSIGLQESIERFSDDRHFSKWLVCRESVWGWDWHKLAAEIEDLVHAGASKGKTRAVNEESGDHLPTVSLEVVGLNPSPVYNVVWSPIPSLARVMLLASRPGLMAVSAFVPLFIVSALLGVVTSGLVVFFGIVISAVWTCSTYLVRTHMDCVYDNIGTAWNLAPKWTHLDVPADWDQERVLANLKDHSTSAAPDASNAFIIDDEDDAGNAHANGKGRLNRTHFKLRQTEQGWFQLKGIDSHEWVQSHRAQILAALT